jgi:hypothetical protein
LYVLGLTKNLLSVSLIINLEYLAEFDDQQILIQKRCSHIGQVLARGVNEGGLYPMRALVHDNDNLCEIWHKRLGNLHYETLPILKNMVQGFPNFKVEKKGVCKGYALGKHVKVVFPSSEHSSRETLDLIHSNVCQPISLASLPGNIYYVPFIDVLLEIMYLLHENQA